MDTPHKTIRHIYIPTKKHTKQSHATTTHNLQQQHRTKQVKNKLQKQTAQTPTHNQMPHKDA